MADNSTATGDDLVGVSGDFTALPWHLLVHYTFLCVVVLTSCFGMFTSLMMNIALSSWLPALDMKINFLYTRRQMLLVTNMLFPWVEIVCISWTIGFGALGCKSRSMGIATFILTSFCFPLVQGMTILFVFIGTLRSHHRAARRVLRREQSSGYLLDEGQDADADADAYSGPPPASPGTSALVWRVTGDVSESLSSRA